MPSFRCPQSELKVGVTVRAIFPTLRRPRRKPLTWSRHSRRLQRMRSLRSLTPTRIMNSLMLSTWISPKANNKISKDAGARRTVTLFYNTTDTGQKWEGDTDVPRDVRDEPAWHNTVSPHATSLFVIPTPYLWDRSVVTPELLWLARHTIVPWLVCDLVTRHYYWLTHANNYYLGNFYFYHVHDFLL